MEWTMHLVVCLIIGSFVNTCAVEIVVYLLTAKSSLILCLIYMFFHQMVIAFTYWRSGVLVNCKYRDVKKKFWQVWPWIFICYLDRACSFIAHKASYCDDYFMLMHEFIFAYFSFHHQYLWQSFVVLRTGYRNLFLTRNWYALLSLLNVFSVAFCMIRMH